MVDAAAATGLDFRFVVVGDGGKVTSTAGGSSLGVSVIRTLTALRPPPLPDPTEDKEDEEEAADKALGSACPNFLR